MNLSQGLHDIPSLILPLLKRNQLMRRSRFLAFWNLLFRSCLDYGSCLGYGSCFGYFLAIVAFASSGAALAQSNNSPAFGSRPVGNWSTVSEGEEVSIPYRAALTDKALATLLDQGNSLETNRRWGEALALYERALRQHPQHPKLKTLMNEAKIHYSLDRRYRVLCNRRRRSRPG